MLIILTTKPLKIKQYFYSSEIVPLSYNLSKRDKEIVLKQGPSEIIYFYTLLFIIISLSI